MINTLSIDTLVAKENKKRFYVRTDRSFNGPFERFRDAVNYAIGVRTPIGREASSRS